MKRTAFFLLSLILATGTLQAVIIDIEEGLQCVESFITQTSLVDWNDPDVNHVMTINCANNHTRPALYIYNAYNPRRQRGRYFIVSADDNARQILAYGDEAIDASCIPDGLQEMIDMYRQQVESLYQGNGGTPGEAAYLAQGGSPGILVHSIAPLIKTKWNQNAPFNNMCPEDQGQRCLTGCASTALSMIMHYHRHANLVAAIPGYTTKFGAELEDLQPIEFDWDNMLNEYQSGNYTAEQADAVARLMRYVGQAELMDYSPSGSTAFIPNIVKTLRQWGYSQQQLLFSGLQYNDQMWSTKMKAELQANRPILYCASTSSNSGHVFIIDGFNTEDGDDFFHINWGWGGIGNGYCALNAFKPTNGTTTYNQGQTMIINIQPAARAISVDEELLTFNEYTGYSQTKTFTVGGLNLTQDVTLQVHDVTGCGVFMVTPSVITPAEANAGKTVEVKFIPCDNGDPTAIITLSSDEIQPVDVSLQAHGMKTTGYITTPADTIYITDGLLPPFHYMKSITIPLNLYPIIGGDPARAPRRATQEPDGVDTEAFLRPVFSYTLTGDGTYCVGMETKKDVLEDLAIIDQPIQCEVSLMYHFYTLGRHEATLTVTSKNLVTKPIVITIIGEAVWTGDYLYGDVNGDGAVDVSDVTTLISYVLGVDGIAVNEQAADMNGDGEVDVSDVTALIQYVLEG